MIWYCALETCSYQWFRDRLALPKSLLGANEFLSVLALCYLCASPSGSARPIVAFLDSRIGTKMGRGISVKYCVHQPEGLPSPSASAPMTPLRYFARF